MVKNTSTIAAILALFVLFLTPSEKTGTAAELKPAACASKSDGSDDPDFTGKIIAVRLPSSEEGYGDIKVLENVRIRNLNGCSFLVGKQVSGLRGEWLGGKTVWVKLEHILMLAEFTSVDEFQKALSELSSRLRGSSRLSASNPLPGQSAIRLTIPKTPAKD